MKYCAVGAHSPGFALVLKNDAHVVEPMADFTRCRIWTANGISTRMSPAISEEILSATFEDPGFQLNRGCISTGRYQMD